MKNKEFHVGQVLVVMLAVVTTLSQTLPELQEVLPSRYAVGLLAITNLLSALLPRIIKVVEAAGIAGADRKR